MSKLTVATKQKQKKKRATISSKVVKRRVALHFVSCHRTAVASPFVLMRKRDHPYVADLYRAVQERHRNPSAIKSISGNSEAAKDLNCHVPSSH